MAGAGKPTQRPETGCFGAENFSRFRLARPFLPGRSFRGFPGTVAGTGHQGEPGIRRNRGRPGVQGPFGVPTAVRETPGQPPQTTMFRSGNRLPPPEIPPVRPLCQKFRQKRAALPAFAALAVLAALPAFAVLAALRGNSAKAEPRPDSAEKARSLSRALRESRRARRGRTHRAPTRKKRRRTERAYSVRFFR